MDRSNNRYARRRNFDVEKEPAAILGLEVLRRYYKLAESRGVDEILAVATSATREADNGTEFLDAIFRETGLMPRVISGMEEARLIFLAARHAIDLRRQDGVNDQQHSRVIHIGPVGDLADPSKRGMVEGRDEPALHHDRPFAPASSC